MPSPLNPLDLAVTTVAFAVVPFVFIWRGDARSRRTGYVLIIGGAMGLALGLGLVIWDMSGSRESLADVWNSLVASDLWRILRAWPMICGVGLLGMLASWVSLIVFGRYLLSRREEH